jgi:CspA family cold shock protein
MFQRSAILATRKVANLPIFAQSMRKFSAEAEVGTVKYFNAPKGYGFITRPEGAEPADAFVHFSQIRSDGFKTLAQGQSVRYTVEPSPKGVSAINVEALTPPPPRPQGQFRPRENAV